jgi:DNA polymerase III epsilon subunit family exonuclease
MSLSRDTLVWDAPTAILDFETTGLSAVAGDRVVEVAIIRTQGLDDPDPKHFQDLVYPDMAMPAVARNIHGIDDEMVMDAPLFSEVLPTIERMLNGAVFVAHNTRFDLDFLKRECWRMDREPPKVKYIIDTLPMARRHFGLPKCGLSALAKRMNIPLTNHHRAMADVKATLGIYREMLQAIDPEKQMTVGEMNDHIEDMGRDGTARSRFSKKLHAAARNGDRVEIDYTRIAGPGSLTTRRQITVQAFRPPNVDAWCHLRDQARVFRLDRIQRVEIVSNP